LGVLAAGILVAIDPVRKINQANDANAKSAIAQIASAAQAALTLSTTGTYPVNAAALVPNELKSVPVTVNAITWTRNAAFTEMSLSYPLQAPAVAGNVWCWRSASGLASEVAACAAP
jgi:hypothetical protein